jgi:hypothetical protein
MLYTFEGTVKEVMETQTWDSGFKKREIVITSDDKFPQDVKFEFLKDSTLTLDNVNVGDEVIINFSIRGNEYKGKYYVNLNGQTIDVKGAAATTKTKKIETVIPDHSSDDDIPF